MAHAWLDSLSEDWVSQPGSDNSDVQLPPPKSMGPRSSMPAANDNSVLSERSANEINITSQRMSSKQSRHAKVPTDSSRGRRASGSSEGSVVHNTVQHQLPLEKVSEQTPEWKRRLVLGDMHYGEQRDLFCSAANGLQGMFNPPPDDLPGGYEEEEDQPQHESTMPSSPPLYSRRRASTELEEEVNTLEEEDEELEHPNDVTPSPSPRRVQRNIPYQLNVEDASAVDTPSNRLGTTHPNNVEIYRDESCLSTTPAVVDNTRKASGQSDTRNEDFSPILIGKHSDEEGKVDFAPLELPADQLKHKLELLRLNQLLWDPEEEALDAVEEEEEEFKAMDSTEEFVRQGGFINFRRGGRSDESSFRHHPLSPSFGVDTSEMLPEESLQASTPKQFPTVRTEATNPYDDGESPPSPSFPRAPFPSPEKRQIRVEGQAAGSGSSPLKLFGPYDTFTNQTLLRRISQFEEGISGTISGQSMGSMGSMGSNATKLPHPMGSKSTTYSGRLGEFGAGDLEGYEFSSDLSYAADDESRASDHNKENLIPQTHPLRLPSTSFPQHQLLPDDDVEIVVRRRRNKSTPSPAKRHMRVQSVSNQLRLSVALARGAPDGSGTPKRDTGSEGKRLRMSPSVDPTPKRRRTLHRSDIAYGRENPSIIEVARQRMQSFMGEKRQDSGGFGYAEPQVLSGFGFAEPQVLASRSILRPRTPSGKLRQASRRTEDGQSGSAEQYRRSPLRNADETTVFPGETPANGDRKPSIRTQDFVDQAAQIMAMIRSQVRPPGLASVEESAAENDQLSPGQSDDLGSESTREPFSRPPSREGKASVSRPPQRQDDPELVDRLRKYQEASDIGDIISSSMRSVGLANDTARSAKEVESQTQETKRSQSSGPLSADEGEMISDIPNVRITTNPVHNESQTSPSRDYSLNGSGQLSSRSYPTTSSRGSDSRKMIMPESVSHLIPERVGSMRLDKNNKVWIKSKEMRSVQGADALPSDSEDDPFASIPDLSVDLAKEMQNLRLTTTRKEDTQVAPEQRDDPLSPTPGAQRRATRGFVTLSPDGQLSPNMDSPAQDELQKLQEKSASGTDVEKTEDVDSETTMNDDQGLLDPLAKAKRRNVTISFSSPVASFIQDIQPDDLDSFDDDGAETSELSPCQTERQAGTGKPALKNGSGHSGAPSRHGEAGFIPRPVSRIDEQDEDSTVELPHHGNNQLSIIGETSLVSHKTPDAQHGSLSFILNRNAGQRPLSARGDDSAVIGQNVGKLSLSPLSEFTLNNPDPSFGFEVSYVMGHRHLETGDGDKKVMSMTIRNLVDKLAEVEPFEPYWEDLIELDLHEKRLTSLHMLDEFCCRIVTLDASRNSLRHLEGVPATVRQLKVSQNMLTELTSWDHLQNLQYVDVSCNELTSLSALKNLVHLRSIRADDNQLTSLDGLDCHEGLLSLRARGNQIEDVDFSSVHLRRLTELDLSGNQISSVQNLELLSELTRLKLSCNRLEGLVVKGTMKTLRQLDVSDNDLALLDLGNFPNLHSLYADRNRIKQLRGFYRARRLDSLSLREQQGDELLDTSFLSSACEIRKLFLSGNYLGVLELTVDFLNLQLLEVANCGLQSLPQKLGQLMPNLRTLNLNFNAISDLSSLRFIPRLKKLLVAGNRLADSTDVTELLTDFPHLTRLDLRDNPVTLGFYAPLQVLVSAQEDGVVDPFVLPEADAEKDEAFARRLDEGTRQRRRLHEIVFVASCKRLRVLDGLRINRDQVLARDEVFKTLVAEDLLPPLDGDVAGDQAEADETKAARDPVKTAPDYNGGEGGSESVENGPLDQDEGIRDQKEGHECRT
ncbi:Protein nud1 [Amphichorda felina]